MDENTEAQWEAVCEAATRLAGIKWGNVSIRIEDGRPTGLVEIRETIKLRKSN